MLFVLAPGGDKTRHVVDGDFLRGMKKHAVLVNTARGTLVDSDALARALREEWIWGAGLDVVEGEPHVGADHPLVKEPRSVRPPLLKPPFLLVFSLRSHLRRATQMRDRSSRRQRDVRDPTGNG